MKTILALLLSLAAFGEIVTGTPEELSALIKRELQSYAKLIRDAKIAPQ